MSSTPNSSFTAMRKAWNTRRTQALSASRPRESRDPARIPRKASASWRVRVIGARSRTATISRARVAAAGSSEFSARSASNRSTRMDARRSDAEGGRCGFRRRSSGPSSLKVKPREGSSSCIEETPRSAKMPSAPSMPSSARTCGSPAKLRRTGVKTSSPKPASRNRAMVFGCSMGSTSRPMRRPSGTAPVVAAATSAKVVPGLSVPSVVTACAAGGMPASRGATCASSSRAWPP